MPWLSQRLRLLIFYARKGNAKEALQVCAMTREKGATLLESIYELCASGVALELAAVKSGSEEARREGVAQLVGAENLAKRQDHFLGKDLCSIARVRDSLVTEVEPALMAWRGIGRCVSTGSLARKWTRLYPRDRPGI